MVGLLVYLAWLTLWFTVDLIADLCSNISLSLFASEVILWSLIALLWAWIVYGIVLFVGG